ncbi:MAG: ABC transporter ATP-binding protein [Lachnospiraceae bacterium]|nr:ABC transporter ATP-binding protein [Lachnospiraceae bacterium]
MRKLLRYMDGYRLRAVAAPLFKFFEAVMELLVPLIVASIIDTGIAQGDHGYIVRRVLLMVLFGVAGLAFAVTAQYFSAKVAVSFTGRIRRALFKHLGTLSYTEIDTIGTDTLITRLTGDMNQIQNGVNLTLRLLMRSPFIVLGATVMAYTVDHRAALVFAGLIPILAIVIFAIMLISIPLYRRVQERLDRVVGALRRNLAGVRVLRAFNKEAAERKDFGERTDELEHEQRTVGGVSALLNPLTYCLVNLAILLLVYTGALRVEAGILTQGAVIALYNYMSQILVELVKLANLIINITRAVACGNRVQSIFEIAPSVVSPEDAIPVDADGFADASLENAPVVSFRDVSLRYAKASSEMLSHISCDIFPGEYVGVIGGTGSGKTSLVQLIPRFYDITDGSLTVFGHNVGEYDLDSLRHAVRVVPQKAVLFAGTIRSNLLFGNPNATDEELWFALEKSCAADFVRALPEGLDAPVSKGGSNFSGGQRQRLTIARAFVTDARILILDDSGSALDYATEQKLRRALREERDRTVLYVSQRAGALTGCDRILVLEDGELVGNGTHDELLSTCPVYREIAAASGLAVAEGGAV